MISRPNAIDKAIGIAFPGWAEKRAVARHNLSVMNELTPGYKGGRPSRRRRQVTSNSAGEDRISGSGDYSKLVAAGINLYRNDPMTRSIVDVVATYMGESRPAASTGDAEFDDEASQYFNDFFWTWADSRRRPGVDYGMLQNLWTRYTFVGGDMLFGLRDDGLYPYEGGQIKTPWDLKQDSNIVNGVRVSKAAPHRITHFYVVNSDKLIPGMGTAKGDYHRIAHGNAIFAPSKYWRPAMLRGVPELHAVIDSLQDYEETNDNVQAKIKFDSSLFTVERKGSLGNVGNRFMNKDSATGEQVEYSTADYGMRFKIDGDPQKDFDLSKMDNPGAQHVPYMEFMGRLIGAGVGLPYEIIAHLYTNGSYTANRAARTDFLKFIMDRWQWRNKVLNQRVWNWAIARAIKSGEIRHAPVGPDGRSLWYKATWTLPHFPQIDEGKEIMADIRQWRSGTTSLHDIANEKGTTRAQMLDQHDMDVKEMQDRANALGITLQEYAGELFKAVRENEAQKPGGLNA